MNRELDIKVAEALGYKVECVEKKVFLDWIAGQQPATHTFQVFQDGVAVKDLPHYSTDIAVAWELFEMMPYAEIMNIHGGYICSFDNGTRCRDIQKEKTAPMAIVRAFLAWKGEG